MIRRSIKLRYRAAVQRMCKGSLLVQTNGKRTEYMVLPGGPISDDTAKHLIKHTLCRPADAGLFGDQPQSWKFDTPQ
jgi:hypothetical protein